MNDDMSSDMNCEMSCEQCQELLGAHVEGLLDEQSSQQITQHLQACSLCLGEFKELDKLHNCLAEYRKAVAQRPAEDRVMDQILRRQAHQSRRYTMTRRYGKVGLAASVAAAIIVALTFVGTSPNGSGTAWAIEQTVKALKEVKNLHFKGMVGERAFEVWCRTDAESARLLDERIDVADVGPILVRRQDVGFFCSSPNTVRIRDTADSIALDPWPGPDYFRTLKENAINWEETYGIDEESGRECIFVSFAVEPRTPRCCGKKGTKKTEEGPWKFQWFPLPITPYEPKSYQFQFDLETKLPVRVKQWKNAECEGTPFVSVDEISYNVKLADDLFQFEIPEGATVIDERKEAEKDQ